MHDDYITYAQIAEEMKVSSRTVIRYIKNIPSNIQEVPIQIEMKRGMGIRMNLSIEERKRLKTILKEEKNYYFSKQDRIWLILYELFSSDNYVKSYYLSARLNVSPGTMERDLEDIDQWLEKNGLKLYSSKGKGICISGKESNIRQGFVNLYMNFVDMKKISYDICFSDRKFFKEEYTEEVKQRYYDLLDLDVMGIVKELIFQWQKEYQRRLLDEDLMRMIVYLVIMLQRNGKEVFMEAHKKMELIGQQSFRVYQTLAEMVSTDFGIEFQKDSIYYFISNMLAKRSSGIEMPENNDLFEIVDKFLQSIASSLNLNLGYDQELMYRLQMHLELMIQRVNMGVYIQNHYLDKLKQNYGTIFKAVKNNLHIISAMCRKKINEDEIGYLVIHILATVMEAERENNQLRVVVVCMNGFGTSRVLSELIKKQFPEIEIVDCVAEDYVNELELAKQKVDFIITTIELETVTIPTILVDPFLGMADEKKIRQNLEFFKARNAIQDHLIEEKEETKDKVLLLKTANQILRDFAFQNVCAENKKELICEICKFLDENIRDEVKYKLLRREQRGSSVIDETGALLLHCRIKQMTMIRCYSLKKEIEDDCNGKKVMIRTVVLMLAPEEENLDILDLFGTVSADLVLKPDLIKLIEEKEETKIYQYISDLLLNYVNQWR